MFHSHYDDHPSPFGQSLLASSQSIAFCTPALVSAQVLPSFSPVAVTAPSVPATQRVGSLGAEIEDFALNMPFSGTETQEVKPQVCGLNSTAQPAGHGVHEH